MIWNYVISALLLVAAALFKAAADTMSNLYSVSIFSKWNPLFWDQRKSFKAKRIFNYPMDGWHLANSGMIISFVLGYVFYTPIVPLHGIWQKLADVAVYGIVFNASFNFFLRLMKLKKYR